LNISSHEVGDTAYYEPERRSVYHYKGARWFLVNAATPGKQATDARDTVEGWHVGLQQWACGHKGVNNLQGTWKDAEDGHLSGNPIAQGSVDSTVAVHVRVKPGETQAAYYWIAVGTNFEEVTRINRSVRHRGPWSFLDRTAAYWKLWLASHRPDFADLPGDIVRLYQLSLLVIRTQVDNDGAIIAANDSDIASAVRDTYSYMWPRDGALVAHRVLVALPGRVYTQADGGALPDAAVPRSRIVGRVAVPVAVADRLRAVFRIGRMALRTLRRRLA